MTDHERLVEAALALLLTEAPPYDLLLRAAEEANVEDLVDDEDTSTQVASALTFEDAGVLTSNRGVVLALTDGSEFQITIVQSRHPRS